MCMNELEKRVLECGGSFALNHSKRLIKIIDKIGEGLTYNQSIMEFCAYAHDLGAYAPYMAEGVDHALRSRQVAAELLPEYEFIREDRETILEVIEKHHAVSAGKSMEAIIFRDADAIDFLGFFGIARNFARAPLDMVKGFNHILRHRNRLPDLLALESSRKLADVRIKEMDQFIRRFTDESFGIY